MSLSDKRQDLKHEEYFYSEDDVKEFVDAIKDDFKQFNMVFKLNIINDMINKRAGKKLITKFNGGKIK